jgi:iron(III) transport system substrate-binding protein
MNTALNRLPSEVIPTNAGNRAVLGGQEGATEGMSEHKAMNMGRRTFLRSAMVVAAGAAGTMLAACGGSSAPAAASTPASPASSPAQKPAGSSAASSAGASPSGSASGAANPPQVSKDNWAQVVEAAKKEGQVIVWGENGQAGKAFEKDAFEKANPGITVELFQADTQSARDQRFMQEFKAGLAKVDVLISGSAGMNANVKPQGMLQDVRPFLLADTVDTQNWREKKLTWVDKEQKYMLQSDTVVYPYCVNKSVDPSELQTFDDLLNPKWKGKIISNDPRQSGAGFSYALFLYYTPELGKDFFTKFYTSGIVFSADEQKNLEWTDQGRALISINSRVSTIQSQQQVGGTFKIIPVLKAGGKPLTYFSGSTGILAIPNLNPLPHPNATAVYVNWFYSKTGQQSMIDTTKQVSARTDVDMSKLPDWNIPQPGVTYQNLNDERFTATPAVQAMRDEMNKIYVAP